MIHISQTSIDILDAFVFFNMFAEGATSFFNISELILVLKEELAAFIANSNSNIRHHVFVILAWPLRAELAIVDNEHFLKAHTLKDSLVNFNSTILVWRYLSLKPLKHPLSEKVIL